MGHVGRGFIDNIVQIALGPKNALSEAIDGA